MDSGQSKFDSNGNYAGPQKAVIAENKLQTMENLTGGLISYKSTGPMTAGSLALGYEKDVGDNFSGELVSIFLQKVPGGRTSSTAAGYDWYDVSWYYKSVVVPVYFGIKLNVGSRSTFYVAPGLHYYRAEWQLKGRNDGNGLDVLPVVKTRNLPVASDAARPQALSMKMQIFWTWNGFKLVNRGFKPKLQKKVMHLSKLKHTSLTQNAGTKSAGGIAAIAPQPTYPVTVGGNVYRIGYKHEL